MSEVVVSPRGYIGKKGWQSSLRHFATGFAAGGVLEVVGFLAPAMAKLKDGDWSGFLELDLSKLTAVFAYGTLGGAVAFVLRLFQRRAAVLSVDIPANGNG